MRHSDIGSKEGIERLDEGVFRWFPWPREVQLYAVQESPATQLCRLVLAGRLSIDSSTRAFQFQDWSPVPLCICLFTSFNSKRIQQGFSLPVPPNAVNIDDQLLWADVDQCVVMSRVIAHRDGGLLL